MNALRALIVLLLLSTALAAPTPADVDAALRSGRPDVALQLVEQARSGHLVSAKLDYLDAVARFRTGDLEGAVQSLARARNIDPALAFANPSDVEAIDRAARVRTGRGFFLGLCLMLLAVFAVLAMRARDRRRKQAAQWQQGLGAMRERVRQFEAQLELELMDARYRLQSDAVIHLREQQRALWVQVGEAERGRLDPDRVAAGFQPTVLKRPVPRRAPAKQAAASSSTSAPTSTRTSAYSTAPSPDTDLLTGVLIGQALTSPPAAPPPSPEPSSPAPDPEPQRHSARDWSDSSLSSSASSWSDSSLSSSDSGSSSSSDTSSSSSSSDSW